MTGLAIPVKIEGLGLWSRRANCHADVGRFDSVCPKPYKAGIEGGSHEHDR